MRVLLYSIQSALKNLWMEKWINILTTLSVGVGLLILSTFVTVTLNMDSVLKRWARSFGIVVYLDDNISAEATGTVREFFRQDPDILEVTFISEDEAIKELRTILGKDASILDDLKDNPLPSSFELKLKRALLEPVFVKKKAEEIEKISGVAQVQYGEKWLASLSTVSRIMKASAIFMGGAILIAIIFITYNTIKIFFYRRKEEIETLKLLGATKAFIRLPFLIEGLVIGLLGGIFAVQRKVFGLAIVGAVLVLILAGLWVGTLSGGPMDAATMPAGLGGFAEMYVSTLLTQAGEGTEEVLIPYLGYVPDLTGITPGAWSSPTSSPGRSRRPDPTAGRFSWQPTSWAFRRAATFRSEPFSTRSISSRPRPA